MAFKQVFKNPTVKQVAFQISFPNFFGMANKIGDYQLKVMEKLPKSSLLIENQILIASTNPERRIENEPQTKKIWQFKTLNEDVILNISSDSLEIQSKKHKTYNNAAGEVKFRETINFLVGELLKLIPLISFTRMGLRYVDDCPLPQPLNTGTFAEYYNSFINVSKIVNFDDVDVIDVTTLQRRNGINLRYRETLVRKPVEERNLRYTMDFDGQMNDIPASSYLDKLDLIHTEIADLFESVIKQPVINIMENE